MGRAYFPVFHDWLEKLEAYSDAECGRLFRACLNYSKSGTEPELNGNERYIWPTLRLAIDGDKSHYEKTSSVRSEAGKAGAEKRWQNIANMANANFAIPQDGKNAYQKQKQKQKQKQSLLGKEKKERENGPTAKDVERMKKMLKEMQSE